MFRQKICILIACIWLLISSVYASSNNPIANPSFEDGTLASWIPYSYTPLAPESGDPAVPTVGRLSEDFNILPPYEIADGSYVCGMESVLGQSKCGGIYQTFTWTAGNADITVQARGYADLPIFDTLCMVRVGIAPGVTANREDVGEWATSWNTPTWCPLTLHFDGISTVNTLFIESYQPAFTTNAMSTLWDNVTWTPYIEIVGAPQKTGVDPLHPDTSAIIHWTTNLPSTSQVNYQCDGDWQYAVDSTLTTDHTITLQGLQPSKKYSFRASSTADGCFGVESHENSFSTPINITTVGATIGDPNVVVSWQTDTPSTSWVDYGVDASYGQAIGDDTLTTSHSVTLTGLTDGMIYHYRVRSGANLYTTATSADRTCRTLAKPQPALGNPSFEGMRSGDTTRLYPWEVFAFASGNITPEVVTEPYPMGGPAFWFPDTAPGSQFNGFQAYDGSYFLGAGARRYYKNGGVYQRIVLNSPQTIAFCARFAAYQSSDAAQYDTRVRIGIDITGGTDPNAPTVKWWTGISPTNDSAWFPAGVMVDAPSGIITVFLATLQQYGIREHAVAIDDAVLGSPETLTIGELKNRTRCTGSKLVEKIVTYVSPGTVTYQGRDYQKIYIQEPSSPLAIGVLLGPIDSSSPSDMPTVGNKITVSGVLVPQGKEIVLVGHSWVITDPANSALPAPLGMTQRNIGGSSVNQMSLYKKQACNVGLRMRLFGKVVWPSYGVDGDVYIDDGSGLPTSPYAQYIGKPSKGMLVRLVDNGTPFKAGDYIAVTGVLSMENLGVADWPDNTYVLLTNGPDDWSILKSAE